MDCQEILSRAKARLAAAIDSNQTAWLTGYIRGVKRACQGERFGTYAEHTTWLTYEHSGVQWNVYAGKGYRAGLDLDEEALDDQTPDV